MAPKWMKTCPHKARAALCGHFAELHPTASWTKTRSGVWTSVGRFSGSKQGAFLKVMTAAPDRAHMRGWSRGLTAPCNFTRVAERLQGSMGDSVRDNSPHVML